MSEKDRKPQVTICIPGVEPILGQELSKGTRDGNTQRVVILAGDGSTYNVDRRRVCYTNPKKD